MSSGDTSPLLERVERGAVERLKVLRGDAVFRNDYEDYSRLPEQNLIPGIEERDYHVMRLSTQLATEAAPTGEMMIPVVAVLTGNLKFPVISSCSFGVNVPMPTFPPPGFSNKLFPPA